MSILQMVYGPKILKVTDAAIKNFNGINLNKVEESVCHTHAFLKFRDVKDQWPNEYALVAEAYCNIYAFDARCRETKMTPEERLAYHQKHSRPWLDKINEFCKDIIARRAFDKKSSLWEPVVFIINQWNNLTKFLEIPGVPLDTKNPEKYLPWIYQEQTAAHFKNSA